MKFNLFKHIFINKCYVRPRLKGNMLDFGCQGEGLKTLLRHYYLFIHCTKVNLALIGTSINYERQGDKINDLAILLNMLRPGEGITIILLNYDKILQ